MYITKWEEIVNFSVSGSSSSSQGRVYMALTFFVGLLELWFSWPALHLRAIYAWRAILKEIIFGDGFFDFFYYLIRCTLRLVCVDYWNSKFRHSHLISPSLLKLLTEHVFCNHKMILGSQNKCDGCIYNHGIYHIKQEAMIKFNWTSFSALGKIYQRFNQNLNMNNWMYTLKFLRLPVKAANLFHNRRTCTGWNI